LKRAFLRLTGFRAPMGRKVTRGLRVTRVFRGLKVTRVSRVQMVFRVR
jgi:hypothetical protein